MFSTLMKSIALSSLLTCSAVALADQSDYKLMVIDNEASSAAIFSGKYEVLLEENKAIQANPERAYEAPFNSCAANVKLNNFADAEVLCTQAIALLKSSKVSRFKRRELTSFALSNRGVARIMAKNDTAALSDFYEANDISTNELVNHNLTRAKQNLAL